MPDRIKSSGDPVLDPRSEAGGERGRLWTTVAIVLAISGMVASLFGANSAAARAEDQSEAKLRSTSAEVAASLQLALDRERDLVVAEGAFVLGNPGVTNADFAEWTTSVQAKDRYPELEALGIVLIVPAADLPAFAARITADPAGQLNPDGSFSVTPPGDRPYYCLAPAGTLWNNTLATPVGYDYCANDGGEVILVARDSGYSSNTPYAFPTKTLLSVQTPVYRGGVVATTLEERRAEFVGLVVSVIDPSVLLLAAIEHRPGLSVSLSYDQRGQQAEFTSRVAKVDDRSIHTDLGNGWTVRTTGPVHSGSLLDEPAALWSLLVGVVLSLLLSALVFVLANGRSRAWRIVAERTSELQYLATHDALTGLPNRALIMDRIEQLLARNRRSGTSGAALFIDLDEFKNVNDTLGHPAGDQLLVAVADRLESTMRGADTIGRMGGDEFVVLVDGSVLKDNATLVAERLLLVLRRPFELEGASSPLFVKASIGIAVGDRPNPADLLRDADVALYQAKAAGKSRYEIFDPGMQADVSERIELAFALRSALENDELRLVYQPIYNLDDLSLSAVEALLRWDHPTKGAIEPAVFIPLLEQSGQIQDVGRWVLDRACEQMATWHGRGDTLDISVNVSGCQLDHDIAGVVRAALTSSGLDPASLIIEITETALMSNATATAARLWDIKALGVRIAVDDFGTGYSSLAYLQRFPVDCLKIDRSFTSAIANSPESMALVSTVVQLGRDLGLTTVAEGVETTEQMDYLRSQHVDWVQGFLLSRPIDPATLETQFLAPTRPPIAAEPKD